MYSHRLACLLTLLVMVASAPGCGVSFSFGAPPIRYSSLQEVDRCVFDNSIKLRAASSNYTDSARFGNLLIIRELSGRGYTFYQGTRRLTAVQALKLLRDEDLRRAYRRIWEPFARESRGWLLGGWITFGAGGGLAIIGSAIAANARINHDVQNDKTAQKQFYAGLGLLGVAALALGIAPVILRSGYKDRAIAESFRTVFISSSYQSNLQAALRRYNARVVQRCRGQLTTSPASPRTGERRKRLSPAQIRHGVKSILRDARACGHDVGVPGTYRVRVTLSGALGKAVQVTVTSTSGHRPTEHCLMKAFMRMRVERFGDAVQSFVFPMVFK